MAALHGDLNIPVLLVTDRADHALQLHDELAFWCPGFPRYLFSEPTPLFYEDAAWGSSTRRERLQTLSMLARYHLPYSDIPSKPPIIVVSARALMTHTLPRRDFIKATKQIQTGPENPDDSFTRGMGPNWVPASRYGSRNGAVLASRGYSGYLATE